MIFVLDRRRLTAWVTGAALLLGLNFTRDFLKVQKKYEWEKITKQDLHRGVLTPGVMEAIHVAEIKSQVEETVEEKMVQEGQPVKKGQPLARLSRSRTKLEYEQKRNSFLNSEADYRKAIRELSIQKKLLRSMAVSRQQVEDAGQAVEKTKAALDITSQELKLVQNKLDSTLVVSPMDGVVLKDFTKVGMAISSGKDLITVGDVSAFIVRAKVDELDIQQVKVGQDVDVDADAFPGKTMRGVVASIATQAERETFAKVEVVINITDAVGLTLKHNLSVRVNIRTENISNALSIPIKSVNKKEGDLGWIVVRNKVGFIRRRRVKLGKTAGTRIEIVSGLSKGEFVGTETQSEPNP